MTETLVLGALDLAAPNPFGPGSMIRRVVGEPIVFALYPRALVMEVAHSSIGAAVADHSRFQTEPIHRLWATADAGVRLVFGDDDEPMGAARQIYRFHDDINGCSAAAPYTAHDASLLLWVWATLVDSCDVAFTRWVRPYAMGEADAFYRDMYTFARFFGIPDHLIPPDRSEFAVYMNRMLESEELGSNATSNRVVRDLLCFQCWFLAPRVITAARLVAVGTLDPRLAERLGLRLTDAEQRQFDRLDQVLRRHYHRLPAGRTELPDAYLKLRRLASKRRPGRA